MAVKSKAVRVVVRPLSVVRNGSECWFDGRKVIKVRNKVLMDTRGKVINVTDATQVKVSAS